MHKRHEHHRSDIQICRKFGQGKLPVTILVGVGGYFKKTIYVPPLPYYLGELENQITSVAMSVTTDT